MPRTALSPTAGQRPLAGRAFEGLPHGLLVLDDNGAVEVTNRAASDLLHVAPDAATRCCELFGCHAAEGPLAGVCLTRIVPPAGEGHLELRLDLAGGSTWVTAAAMEDRRVVVQV